MSVSAMNLTNGAFVQLTVMTGVLATKGIAVNFGAGISKAVGSYSVYQEDKDIGLSKEVKPDYSPETKRWNRIIQNDHENIPSFLMLALLWVLAGATASETKWPFFIFTVARILHSIVFAAKMQPARTITFGAAALAHFYVLYNVLALSVPKLLDSLS